MVQIEKSGDTFRLMYDTKGRFVLHAVGASEAGYKLCRVEREGVSPKGIPYIATHVSDGAAGGSGSSDLAAAASTTNRS